MVKTLPIRSIYGPKILDIIFIFKEIDILAIDKHSALLIRSLENIYMYILHVIRPIQIHKYRHLFLQGSP